MSAELHASHLTPATPEEVFAVLVRWDEQEAWMPLTRVETVDDAGGRLVARTRFGPLTLIDEMRVDAQVPARSVHVVHEGPHFGGTGEFRFTVVSEAGALRTRIDWYEWITGPGWALRGLPVAAGALRWGMRRGLRALAGAAGG